MNDLLAGLGAAPNAQGERSVAPALRMLPTEVRQRIAAGNLDMVAITLTFTLAANGAPVTLALTADADADVVLLRGMRYGTTAADKAAEVKVPATVAIQNGSSGRSSTVNPAHVETLFGSAGLPCEFPAPILVRSNSNVNVTAANIGAAAYELRLTFLGFKVYK